MNNKAQQLNMSKTKYANSHGLVNPENKSCAYDLAILCEHAMSITKFREIVSCKIYKNTISCQQLITSATNLNLNYSSVTNNNNVNNI